MKNVLICFLCFGSLALLGQAGGVTISSSNSTEDGTIRYESGDFEGLKAGIWTSLTSAGGGSSLWTNGAGSDVYYDGAGQVGIGTSNPIVPLHIEGVNTLLRLQNPTTVGNLTLDFYEGSSRRALLWLESNDDFSVRSELGKLNLQTGGNIDRLTVGTNGFIGIGTTFPSTVLDLATPGADIRFSDSNYSAIQWFEGATEKAFLTHNGDNVILQNRDAGVLELEAENGTIDMISNEGVNFGQNMNTPSMEFIDVGSGITNYGELQLNNQNFTASNKRSIFISANGSNNEPYMILYKKDGTEGIKLDADVSGDSRIIVDELQIVGGSDFAENFDIIKNDVQPIPGMVVSIDPSSSGKLIVAAEAYDKKVAGIISGANGVETGVMMGQKGSVANGDYPIALSGRVYVYANDENGEIKPGDFLTSSSVLGHAMKVTDHTLAMGSVIGKAMTKVDENGFVLVLVNLQ